jgi:signal recognition particle subunit SRP19
LSRDYKGKKIIVYPQYIDSTKSRSEGRRIPRNEAVAKPRIEEIIRAAEELGLNPILEAEASYPREWWVSGRVIVDKIGSKIKTLRIIARKIKELREK